MAFKRLIAMVPVLHGQVVMSCAYKRHRPAGHLDSVLKNLDRWGVDEIVVMDISPGLSRPDLALLEQVRRSAVRTPVAFGGGIRSAVQAVEVIALGCDRVIVETLLWEKPQEIAKISSAVGQQAVIGATPLVMLPGGLHAQAARDPKAVPWREFEARIADAAISELLLIDRAREGLLDGIGVAAHVPERTHGPKLIWFGGVAPHQAAGLLARQDTVGLAIGNPFLRHELAALHLRQAVREHDRHHLLREVRPHV
jgi:cyclase